MLQKVQSSKSYNIYQELLELVSSKDNYKLYRMKLHSCTPPCVPYLGQLLSKRVHCGERGRPLTRIVFDFFFRKGVYLTDLTFIEEGIKDDINGRPEMINFTKRRQVSVILREIQQLQRCPYALLEEKTIRDYMASIEGLTEKALYKYSLLCEPRSSRDSPAKSSLLRRLKVIGY